MQFTVKNYRITPLELLTDMFNLFRQRKSLFTIISALA
jgi:hypothetical protein